jgi:hypothetical protein
MSFIDRHILMLTIATYIPLQQAKYQRHRRMLQETITVTEITQQYMVEVMSVQQEEKHRKKIIQ